MRLDTNFNGGPDGTSISPSNSGQFGDDAVNLVNAAGAGGYLGFTDAGAAGLDRPTAQYVLEVATGGGSAQAPYVAWTSSLGTQTTIYTRFYLYFTSIGATAHDQKLLQLYASSGGVVNVSVALTTSTSPIVLALVSGAAVTTKAAVTPVAGQWNRVEFFANINSANSSGTLRLYAGDDVDTNNITDSASQSTANYNWTSTNTIRLGQIGNTTDAFPSIYFSNWEVNNTGWPGPAPFRQGQGSPAGNLTNPVAHHMI